MWIMFYSSWSQWGARRRVFSWDSVRGGTLEEALKNARKVIKKYKKHGGIEDIKLEELVKRAEDWSEQTVQIRENLEEQV